MTLPSSVVLVLHLLWLIAKTTSNPTYLYNVCSNDTMFAPSSQYQTNLNTVFSSLSSNSTSNPTGFNTAAAGNSTHNPVYGLFLCRGDQNSTACSNCVTTATTKDLPKTYCPNNKVAIIWYNECMVRYSNVSFFGKIDQSPFFRSFNEQNITGNPTLFTEVLGSAMNDVAVQAANEQTGKKYATRVVNVSSRMTLYALAQCTPDLTPSDCNLCLRIGIGMLQVAIDGNNNLLTPPFTTDSTSTSQQSGKRKEPSKFIIPIVVPLVVVSAALLAILVYVFKKKAKKHIGYGIETGDKFTTMESLKYELGILQSATNYFSHQNKLGEGGFGGVYKGILSNGQEITVKRLSRHSGQGVQEFQNEVYLVARLQHRNLVRLLGFCLAREEKLLVYEHVPNKSLDFFIFDDVKQRELNWEARYKIIVGVARGMLYLHQDSRPRIIHRDLKASNILLDADMNPKIADFGMAKIFGVDQTQGNTKRVVGTYGYMSPEYAMHGQFSVKSDVYSYGVLVLEIISGKRNSAFYQSGYADDLISYAWRKWKDEASLDVVDPTIKDLCSTSEVTRCIQIGLLCVQQSANKRPTMATLVHKLDVSYSTLPLPEKPAYFAKNIVESDLSKDIVSDQSRSKLMPWSVNDISITDFEPR